MIHERPRTSESLPTPIREPAPQNPVQELQKLLDRHITMKLTQNEMHRRIVLGWPTEVMNIDGKIQRKSEQLDFADEIETQLLELRSLFVYTSFEDSKLG